MLANATMRHGYPNHPFGETATSPLGSIVDDPNELLVQSRIRTQADPSTELEILSASRYPQALIQPYESSRTRPKRKANMSTSSQLYGGLLVATETVDSTISTSLKESDPGRSRKKVRRAASDDEDDIANDELSKRQRGRPRLETQDETPADRRRTQIRLAQRAYRHRKETTISGLKKRVSELQDAIKQMNQTFLTLHDNMVNAGILDNQADIAEQLHSATNQFVALAKNQSDSDLEDEPDRIVEIARNPGGSRPSRSTTQPTTTVPSSNTASVSADPDSVPTEEVDLADNGYSEGAEVEKIPAMTDVDIYFDPKSSVEPWAMNNTFFQFNAQIPDVSGYVNQTVFQEYNDKQVQSYLSSHGVTPTLFDPALNLSIERPLTSPAHPHGSYTYSFQETTFARRLHRMCLEHAFRNLSNPDIDPGYVKSTFRFTLCFSNRKRILGKFNDILKRKAGESLENWEAPFFHIGGAGLHFPRHDENTGAPIYPPNILAPETLFGPHPPMQGDFPLPGGTAQETLEMLGFGGEWFDSHDVEEYLKTKGIFLDGQSSFVEIDPSLVALPSSPVNSSSESPASGGLVRTPSPIYAKSDAWVASDHHSDLLGQQHANGDLNLSMSGNGMPKSVHTIDGENWQWQTWPAQSSSSINNLNNNSFQRALTPVTFDVDKFLERMIQGGACLGRAPGFRKDTIDNALALSLQEAF